MEDLVDGLRGRGARRPQPPAAPIFWPTRSRSRGSELGDAAARIMGRQPRIVRVPAPAAYAVGSAPKCGRHLTGKPGIISREKVAEARCRSWTCDAGRAAAELGFEAPPPLETGLRQDPRLVQGGRLAEILKPDPVRRLARTPLLAGR